MMETITPNYLQMQKELHKDPSYGVASLGFSEIIANFIRSMEIKSVSDYGAGKKKLLTGLQNNNIANIWYYPYDPAFPEYGEPRAADLVCCIDVLEHIEPELLENVLIDLAKITVNFGFFSIHMSPAAKTLPDGRNAHLIQKPSSWWLPKLCNYFEILQLQEDMMMGGAGIWLVVKPKVK